MSVRNFFIDGQCGMFQSIVGNTTPKHFGPGCVRKVAEHEYVNESDSKLTRSILAWFAL